MMTSMECVKGLLTPKLSGAFFNKRVALSIQLLVDREVEHEIWLEVNEPVHDVAWRQIRDEIYEIR